MDKTFEATVDEYYGVEHEFEQDTGTEDDSANSEKPFDAEKIRIDQQMLSVRYIYDLMKDDTVILNPDFQRYLVWKELKRKSLLIESLMLRIPIPAFYFYETKDAKFIVIDGQQRLSTILEFIDGNFKLKGLEYLGDSCNGKTYNELDVKYQQRINRTQMAVNILDARSPSKVIFDIFRRVNTGGVSLRPQEIRNAIAVNKVRNFLKRMKDSEEFKTATRNRINDERMDAQELVLRFIAFYNAYNFDKHIINYVSNSLAEMLDEMIEKMNKMTVQELDNLGKTFLIAMKNSHDLFGEFCFNKVYKDSNNKIYRSMDVINKSLFTSVSVILADSCYDGINFSAYKEKALELLALKLEDDRYFRALTVGTGDRKSIEISFAYAKRIITGCMELD